MANTNRYADAVFQDNPSAIWTLDDTIAGTPQLLSGTPAIALPIYGIATDAYSESQNSAYYISPTSSLSDIKVENFGLPMVYGAINISNLYENTYTINTNLSINPSFEANLTGWNIANSPTSIGITTEQSYSGTSSIKVTQGTASWFIFTPAGTSGVPVTAGSIYSLSAYVRSSTASEDFQVFIRWYNSSGTLITDSTGSTGASSTTIWTRLSVSATAPVGAAYASLRVRKIATGTSGLFHYIDAVLFEKSNTPSGYFDGSSVDTTNIDYLWSGTINYSSSIAKAINYPSLIVPGYGLFNENGRNKTMSIEFWARITSDTHYPRKIMGPIAGSDGLYVNGPFIMLKINDYIGSHYVGEWGRPMLINVSYSPTFASVIINGEQVINLQYSYTDITFPARLDANSDSQDYIGFYAYSNVPLIQIDCVSIYPYSMQPETAKLHFVKGQAVQSPEITQTQYASLPVVIDYQVSKFANNYVYPGNGRWENGITENMSINQNVISAPDYLLPTIVFEDETKILSDWYDAQKDITYQSVVNALPDGNLINHSAFFEINPNETDDEWASAGYMVFEDFSKIINDPVKAFYVVFSTKTIPTVGTEQVLFRLINSSGEYLESVITTNTGDTAGTVIYRFVSGGTSSTILTINDTVTSSTSSKNVVGIDIAALVDAQVSNNYISSFFSNASSLKLFVGGTAGFEKTFYGQIYKVGFCNEANLKPIKSALFTNGIADVADVATFSSRFSSYTLFADNSASSFAIDIAVAGSWKDYVPVSLLAKNVIADSAGHQEYSLDHIQVNFDYPEMSNTTNSIMRSYVEFEEIGTSIVSSSQLSKSDQALPANYVVDPNSTWLNKRYEILDNSIIHLPSGGYDDFSDLSLAVNFDFKIPGIMRNPIKMKSLQIASLALNYSGIHTEIGTKYSQEIYPYTKTATTTVYDGVNPFTIYKNSTPYLYLTEKSGVKLVGANVGELNTNTKIEKRAIAIPVNQFGKKAYSVSLFQMSAFHKKNFPANGEIEVFRVLNYESEFVIDAVVQSGNKTALLRARKLNSAKTAYETFSDVAFFVNGVPSSTIKVGVWNMICVQFTKTLSFADNNNGLLKLTGPFLYNNIVDYQVNVSRLNQNIQFSLWSEVQARGTWENAYDVDEAETVASWLNILISAEVGTPVSINAISTYSSYLGNSKIVANDDSWFTYFDQSDFELYNGIRSETIRLKPL